ncbi:flagellar motor protein MotB [Pasteurella multocida]|nr:OmpA family protein [Pasteurella multocida]
MKNKPNEWISISDLMSGVMAVVMLLLVMSVLQKTYAELKHKQLMEQGIEAKQKKISSMLTELKKSISNQGANDLVAFNIAEARITLKDNVFEKGSACITPLAITALKSIEDKITEHVKSNSNNVVFVEGHTDNIPVSVPVTNYEKYCTVYDDNFTLSSARAREARKILVANLTQPYANQVIVAGYGDSRPIEGISPENPLNRRIEIQFLISKN